MVELFSNLGLNWKLLAAQLFNFLLVLWILNRFVFKRLIVFLEERKERIEKGVELTERAEKEMDQVAKARRRGLELAKQETTALLSKARSRAELQGKELELEARSTGESIIKKAKEQAGKEQLGIVVNAKNEINEIAALAAGKVLKRSLTKKDEELLLEEITQYLKKEYVK